MEVLVLFTAVKAAERCGYEEVKALETEERVNRYMLNWLMPFS